MRGGKGYFRDLGMGLFYSLWTGNEPLYSLWTGKVLLPVNCEGIIIITVKWDCQYIFTVNWENTIYCELGMAFYFLCDLGKCTYYRLAYWKKFLASLRSAYQFFLNNIPICRCTYACMYIHCMYMYIYVLFPVYLTWF